MYTRGWFSTDRLRPDDVGRIGFPLGAFAVILLTWEIGVSVTNTSPLVLPAPTAIGAAFLADWISYLAATGITAVTAGGGLAIGIAVGFTIAFGITQSRSLGSIILPYVIALRIAPLVAIAPLFVVWLGYGIGVRILLVSTMTVFPITIASYDGLRSVPQSYVDLGHSVKAPNHRVFVQIRVRHALPSVFAGLKLAAALAVIGAVVAEFVTLRAGIGYRVFAASNALRVPEMFAALGCLTVLGLTFFTIAAAAERSVR